MPRACRCGWPRYDRYMTHGAAASDQLIMFGVGCFSFEAPNADHLLMENPTGTYSVHDWASDVERYLAALPSIDNIRVEGFRSVRGDHPLTWRDTTVAAIRQLDHDGSHHGGDLRPHPTVGRVSFTVTIPLRTQAEVMVYAEGRTGTRFDVDIRYGAGMPVAFVRTYEDQENPSLAVAIVREFLLAEERARGNESSPIRFVAMGPSPLWSNFGVRSPDPDINEDLEVELIDNTGYNWVALRARQTESVSDRERAYDLVKARLQDAASTYYEFISQGLVRYTTRRYIESALEDLVTAHRAHGPEAWLRRLWSGGSKANDLMLEILAVDLEQRRASESNNAAWSALEDSPGGAVLDPHVQRELRDGEEDYVAHTREVVGVLNSRHAKDLEIVAVVLASVLGGAVGAALTAIAGFAGGTNA